MRVLTILFHMTACVTDELTGAVGETMAALYETSDAALFAALDTAFA